MAKKKSADSVKKKVLFVITKGNFGGAQKYVYDLATKLPKDSFETSVVCGEGEELPKFLQEAGILTTQIPELGREIGFKNEFIVCQKLIKIIRSEKPDVIHLNSSKVGGIGAVAGRTASLLEKNYSPRIIFTSHGWGFYETHRKTLARIFYYASHWVTVLLSHRTIAVSQKTKRDISWLPFMDKKIEVVRNGMYEFETSDREEARKILLGEKGAEPKVIIYSISELHKNKGLDVALKAIAALQSQIKEKIIYSIAGNGEEKESLLKLAQDLGLETQTNFLGYVDGAKKLLSGADIFLMPSRTENLPFVILEAGLKNLPVIATSVGGIPEIITDMKSGILVHKENPKEIVEGITYLLEHPDRAYEFGQNLQKIIRHDFSTEKMIEKTIKIYEKN